MLSDAVAVPTVVGVNVTLIVQLASAASEVPQLLLSVCANAFALGPVNPIEVIVNVTLPLLVRVTDWAVGLVVPTGRVLKVRVEGESIAPGVPVPIPVSGTI
jgi:hypothetical protein